MHLGTLHQLCLGSSIMVSEFMEVRHVLMLANIATSKAGKYRGKTSNECGNATETANLEVTCKYICVNVFRAVFI